MCKLSAEDKLDDWISYLHRHKTNIFCSNGEEKEIKFACEQEKFVCLTPQGVPNGAGFIPGNTFFLNFRIPKREESPRRPLRYGSFSIPHLS